MKTKYAQGLIEYVLVFFLVTLTMYFVAGKIDLNKIKSFALYGINQNNKITIPPMTD